jgi:hypothetical protein
MVARAFVMNITERPFDRIGLRVSWAATTPEGVGVVRGQFSTALALWIL